MTKGYVPFALGFRPFFLCAGLAGALLLVIWLCFLGGHVPANAYYGPIGWHSHEMLFGFTTAIIAGFLLTAVRNWTGINTITGKPLAALAGLWLVGRILPFLPVPGGLIALVDLAFLPALALALRHPLMEAESKANRVFLVALGLATVANLLVHLQALGVTTGSAIAGTGMMRYLILWILVIISGRIMPFFTRTGVPGVMPVNRDDIERLAVALLFALMVADVLSPTSWVSGLIAAALAVVHVIRVKGWYDHKIWTSPILWVLYTAYFWLIASFALQALSTLGWVNPNLATHAFTYGTVGIFTMGMMSRVALGHSGRMLVTAKPINIAFMILNAGAFVRVLMPIVAPGQYNIWLYLSGGLWVVAFVIFSVIYVPILIRPRADGQPG